MARAVSKEQQEQLVLAHLIDNETRFVPLSDIAEATGLPQRIVEERLGISIEHGYVLVRGNRYKFNALSKPQQ